MQNFLNTDTIVALSTPSGSGAIAIIRLSGNKSSEILKAIFKSKKNIEVFENAKTYFGEIVKNGDCVDEVVVCYYNAPKTYTGEDLVEINCHCSSYIISTIISYCMQFGARLATAGEFTQRAFLNGKMDLSQAEAVADLIASENQSQHQMAMNQMRGNVSTELNNMRNELVTFAALLELELDFSEEDVTFANREEFDKLLNNLKSKLQDLENSFAMGNAIKNGIPVAIVGKPNVGKSTLLNILLNEERAIVSNIAGTTRDTVEDIININGITFRFIDTAGIRESNDEIEIIGIEKAYQKIKEATIILLIVDVNEPIIEIENQYQQLHLKPNQTAIILLNKIDESTNCNAMDTEEALMTKLHCKALAISAKTKLKTEKINNFLMEITNKNPSNSILINNKRHLTAIQETLKSIHNIQEGFTNNLHGEFIAIDVKNALYQLGTITGAVELDRDILGTIFGKFCIGK